MGYQQIRLVASGVGCGLLLLTPLAVAGADAADESFEVIVVRGAGVARVTGDRSGVIQEEILREDPRPARAPRKARRSPPASPAPVIVVVHGSSAGPSGYVPAYFSYDRGHRYRKAGHGVRWQRHSVHHRRVWHGDRSSRRSHHARSRGHGRHGIKPHGRRH